MLLKRLVRRCHNYRNDIAESNIRKVVPMVIGPQGCGKSSIIQQVGEDMNESDDSFGFVQLTGSLLEHPSDVLGYPVADEENGETIHLPPDWFNKTQQHPEGILFIDEFLRIAPPAQNAMYNFLLEFRIGDEYLPEGWTIITATNPPTQDFHVEEMDQALKDRFLFYPFGGSKGEWFEWASRNEMHEDIVGFYEEHPGLIDLPDVDIPFEVEATHRSLELMNILYDRDIQDDMLHALVSGLIGEENFQAFKEFVVTQERNLSPADILEQYPRYQKRVKEYADPDSGNRTDLLNTLTNRIIDFLDNKAEQEEDLQKYKKNFRDFILDVPADMGQRLFNEVGSIDPDLVKSEDIYEHLGVET